MTTSLASGYAATKVQVDELFTVLSIMRPHQSKMEAKFIKEFLSPFAPRMDGVGNLMVRVGDAPILWSCHVDTVHNYGGIAPLEVNEKGIIHVPPYSLANCLGADDGAGVWLMMQMIRAGKEGLYVFHRGEERGCIGSKHIATKTPKVLDGIQAAIAFDRKGTKSIITHQFCGRCCSEDFSESLAAGLGLDMESDPTGSVTDTAQYIDHVGECTNVSVGYFGQHGKCEEQDLPFILELHQRLLELDTRDLVFKRKPGDKEPRRGGNGARRTYSGPWGGWDGENFADGYGGYGENAYGNYPSPKYKWEQGKVWDEQQMGYVYPNKVWDVDLGKWVVPTSQSRNYMDSRGDFTVCRKTYHKKSPSEEATEILTPDTHLQLVKDFPEEIAMILKDKMYGLSYLHEQVRKHGGKIETGYTGIYKGRS